MSIKGRGADLRGKKQRRNQVAESRYKNFNSTHLYGTESVFCAAHKVFSEIIRAERLRSTQHIVVQAQDCLSTWGAYG